MGVQHGNNTVLDLLSSFNGSLQRNYGGDGDDDDDDDYDGDDGDDDDGGGGGGTVKS